MAILNAPPEPPRERVNLLRVFGGIAAVAVAVVLIAFAIVKIQNHQRAVADQEMQQAARQFGSQIEIAHVFFNTGENFLGDRVRYLNLVAANHTTKPVELLEVTFTFVDQFGQTVLRTSKLLVDEHKAALNSGDSRSFSVGFEKLPQDWNHQHPSIQITRLKLAP